MDKQERESNYGTQNEKIKKNNEPALEPRTHMLYVRYRFD